MAMRFLIILVVATVLASCTSNQLANEPADLVAPGRQISDLREMGWKISQPIKPIESAVHPLDNALMSREDKNWKSFTAKMAPGDDLRSVHSNSGIGFAIFRGDTLIDMFLVVIV